MTVLSVSRDLALDMRVGQLFPQLTGQETHLSHSREFCIHIGDSYFVFYGRGYGRPNGDGVPTTGTIETIEFCSPDGTALMTGLSISASAFASALGNPAQIHALLFSGNDTICGATQNDWLMGYAGNDWLRGFNGNDVLDGGAGADKMEGGAGNDVYYVDNAGDRVIEAAGCGYDTVKATVSVNVSGQDIERVILAGSANINVSGNGLDNVLCGNAGNNGIYGGEGQDILTGGAGRDRFDFNAVSESSYSRWDRITDLSNEDIIDLSTIDANTKVAGNQAFCLVNAFSGKGGEITLSYNAGSNYTLLAADVHGDKVADLRIVLNGDHREFDNFIL